MPPKQECFKTACFFVDARRFYRKWLADMRDKQDVDGSGQFPQFAPVARMGGSDGGPGWSDAGERVARPKFLGPYHAFRPCHLPGQDVT